MLDRWFFPFFLAKDIMAFFTPSFYMLNTHQHFTFPHGSCDTYSDEALAEWFYRPDYFCFYILKYFKPEATTADLESYKTKELTVFGIAWMRLKFLAEVLEPTLIAKKYEKRAFSRPLFLPYIHWANIDVVMSRYIEVDRLANYLSARIISVFETQTPIESDHPLLPVLHTFSSSLPLIRAEPLEQVEWAKFSPNELMIYPYFALIERFWLALEPVTHI